tara:strand:+ start:326 stop:574 length:249 start_codon:yes stop_codon:yes gene_type:complete
MEIDKLPNVKKYWINNGYLNIELKDNHLLRMNFNNMETLKEQLTLTDVVVPKGTLCRNCGSDDIYACFLTDVKVCNKCHYQD